ncbi:MAG: ATP-binding protein [Gemmatimonadota bacterium]
MLTASERSNPPDILPSFEEEFEAGQTRAVRTACLVASPLLLLFALLDIWIVPDSWRLLLGLRLGAAITFLGLAWLLQRRLVSPRITLLTLLALVMAPITVGALYSGATSSPYVYAAMLPMAGAALLVPLRTREAAEICVLVLVLLYLPLLTASVPINGKTVATSGSFLFCMATLTVVGATIRRGVLRSEYEVRRQAAGRLGLANLGMLAGGLAHEIANPLTVVKMALDNLLHDPEWPAEAQEDLELMASATSRMQNVLTAMRSQTRLAGLRFKEVDLAKEVEGSLLLVQDRLRKMGIRLDRQIEPVPPVQGEGTLLGQVILNLLINATDAALESPNLPWMQVRVRTVGETVVVEVEDSGPGVPENARDRIFTPLYTTKGDGGTGLGLWLSTEIAHSHQGALTVHDGSEGGALFRLTIPITAQESRHTGS